MNEKSAAGLNPLLGKDERYPLWDVLRMLAEAAGHLHNEHNCDHAGYETMRQAAEAARMYARRIVQSEQAAGLNDSLQPAELDLGPDLHDVVGPNGPSTHEPFREASS